MVVVKPLYFLTEDGLLNIIIIIPIKNEARVGNRPEPQMRRFVIHYVNPWKILSE